MTLDELISYLSERPQDAVVRHGFGRGHSYRGDYCDAAFEPVEEATIGEMLSHAKTLLGSTQCGYKGGEYVMEGYVDVHIAEYGCCGEPITGHHFLYWDTFAS